MSHDWILCLDCVGGIRVTDVNAAKRDNCVWLGLSDARVVERPPLVLSLVVCFVFQTSLALGLKPRWAILGEGARVRHPISNTARVI